MAALPIFEDLLVSVPNHKKEEYGRNYSNARARELEIVPILGEFDLEHLKAIHYYLFQDISSKAGEVREHPLSKGGWGFADVHTMAYIFEAELPKQLKKLESSQQDFEQFIDAMVVAHSLVDEAHPFVEGNGRSSRVFFSLLAKKYGYELGFTDIQRDPWVDACIRAIHKNDYSLKRLLFAKGLSRHGA